MERYVRHRVKLGKMAPSTAYNTRCVVHNWLRYAADWEHPTPDELTEWVVAVPSQDGKHRRAAAVRTFYRYAQTHRWVDHDIASMVPGVNGSAKDPRPIPDLVLLTAMAGATPRNRDAMILGRFAGLRASEIAAVHSDHLILGQLRVMGKGSKLRSVPAHPDVARIAGRGGWVFPNGRGSHVNGQTMSKWMSAALPEGWTAHTLRHAFATDLYESTLDLGLVAEVLGHASTVTTERYVRVRVSRAAGPISTMRLAA